jgi:hypothetical protein
MIVGLGLGVAASSHFVVSAAAEVIRKKSSVIAFGNAQIDTAQSKFGGSSGLFDGTGDYLNVPASPQFKVDSSNFTIEFWMRPAANTGVPICQRTGSLGAGSREWFFYYQPDNKINFGISSSSALMSSIITSSTYATGSWYHIAAVKNGSTVTLYVDGTDVGSQTLAGNIGSDSLPISIAHLDNSLYYNGYLDEIRISKTARYTTGFTPSTTPFVNDEDTILLLHMDGTDGSTYFEDDNGIRSKKSVIAFGNAQIDTAQYKVNLSSAYFDGTGDYLKTGDAISLNGTGDFTVEMWFRTDDATTSAGLFDARRSGSTNPAPIIYFASSNVYWFAAGGNRIQSGAGGDAQVTISANTWYHLAVVRSSNSTKMYIDGVNVGVTYTDNNNYPSNVWTIGENYVLSAPYGGHIDQFRVSHTASYTANFTPSTEPFVNDADTEFLLHMDGTDAITAFLDDNGSRKKFDGVAQADAQLDTAQSKFGGTSLLLDGTGDRVDIGYDADLVLDYTDWTVEYWIRLDAHTGNYTGSVAIWSDATADGGTYYFSPNIFDTTNKAGWQYFYTTTGSNRVNSGAIVMGDATVPTGQWVHQAFVKVGNTVSYYEDGVKSSITHTMTGRTIATNTGASQTFKIGGLVSGGYVDGYIDEVRISKVARYTATFTPQTTPFQNDADTLLLMHMDGTDALKVFTDDNGVTPDHDYGA